jgi:hypothetical protein
MQSGNVFFLAGTFGGPATRTCTIRTGTSVLISILATVFGSHLGDCLSPGWGNPDPCDVETLRASAAAEEDNPQTLELSLDGIPLKDLAAYRAKSPVFSFALGDGTTSQNIVSYLFNFPVPDGTYYPAVADGYWVMFTPLQPGVHTIVSRGVEHVGSTLPPVELNYTLIVVAGR